MKKARVYFIAVFCLLILLQSCKKYNSADQNHQTIQVTLKLNESYRYDLGSFGDEEGASISQQALHYDSSYLTSEDFTQGIYHYKPAVGYTGSDEVELKSERGSDGASPNNKIQYTRIQFAIGE